MHEIGILIEVVKNVEDAAREYKIEKINALVLQIGELSSMIPQYIESIYPIAVEGSMLEGSTLEIELLPANALCRICDKVFPLIKNNYTCPLCKGVDWEMLSGREFMIKEIVCY